MKIGIFDILRSSGSIRIKAIKLFDYWAGSIIFFFSKPRKDRDIDWRQIKKILIIRPGGIGDAVFLLPVIRALKKQYPPLEIDVLCERRNSQIFSSQKDLSLGIYQYDQCNSLRKIFYNQYDVVFDTEQWHYLSAVIASRFLDACCAGFSTRPWRSKFYHQKVSYGKNVYELMNFINLFRCVFQDLSDQIALEGSFHIPDDAMQWAEDNGSQNNISLFVGASIAERRLTSEQSLAIIKYLDQRGCHVALCGGKDSFSQVRRIDQNLQGLNVTNFVGKTTLIQSSALIKTSKLFIGPDSGLLHLAVAIGAPTVGIFGPGNKEKWAPRGSRHSIFTKDMECSPCTHYGYTITHCLGRYPCMRELNIEELLQCVEQKVNS